MEKEIISIQWQYRLLPNIIFSTQLLKSNQIVNIDLTEGIFHLDSLVIKYQFKIQWCAWRVSVFATVVCDVILSVTCHVLILLFSELTAGLAGGQLGLGVPCVTSPYTIQAAAAASPATPLAAAAAAQAAPGKARSSMNLGMISGR